MVSLSPREHYSQSPLLTHHGVHLLLGALLLRAEVVVVVIVVVLLLALLPLLNVVLKATYGNYQFMQEHEFLTGSGGAVAFFKRKNGLYARAAGTTKEDPWY